MQELTPKEYADLLNSEGELVFNNMTDEQKVVLLLAKTLRPSDGARTTLGKRCNFCRGSGWTKGGAECVHCNGYGYIF